MDSRLWIALNLESLTIKQHRLKFVSLYRLQRISKKDKINISWLILKNY